MTAGEVADRAYDVVLRARAAARWGAGATLATWRYATHTTRVARDTRRVRGDDHGPSDRPVGGDQGDVQTRSDGAGPSLRRRYAVTIGGARMSAAELIDAIARDPNAASPIEVSRFVKTAGLLGEMAEGDEYLVWLPGPWNGPVRVADRTATSFRLATLRGHMEAGEIEFRARPEGDDLVFEIESVARSGSTAFWLVYGPLRVAQEIQLYMWAHFCEQAARIAGGAPDGRIRATTLLYPDDHGDLAPTTSRRARRAFAGLQRRELNFDPDDLEGAGPATDWTVDDHRAVLPAEAPGPPEDGGSWETARDLVAHYRFADPRLIEAVYRPGDALEGRNMLLQGRFLGMTFLLGARVAAVRDGEREVDGRPERVWGWSYRTLEGHLERGQMDFEAVKLLDTGEVEFRIHAVSRRAPIRNPVIRIGFRLLGRRLQLRFARLACARMPRLVDEALAAGRGRDQEGGVTEVDVPAAGRPDDTEAG